MSDKTKDALTRVTIVVALIAAMMLLAYGASAQDTCVVTIGRYGRPGPCEWRLMPRAIIIDGVPVRDTVEWRWVRERRARHKQTGPCGASSGVSTKFEECLPDTLR